MLRFPGCKINIGLFVVEKRSDAYHNLETVFYPLPIEDALEIVPSPDGNTKLHLSGIDLKDDTGENLVIKSYRLLEKDFQLPPLHFYLHKNIPFGAGLGGGSSDAAMTLNMLNEMFALNLTADQLRQFASKLGADCPFFIDNKPAFATGIGDILQEIPLHLSGYWVLVVIPSCGISTKNAYGSMIPQKAPCFLPEAVKRPISEWKNMISNDFEKNIFEQYPAIRQLKILLYENDALYASMTGSGSAVYGIFEKQPKISFPQDYRSFKMQL